MATGGDHFWRHGVTLVGLGLPLGFLWGPLGTTLGVKKATIEAQDGSQGHLGVEKASGRVLVLFGMSTHQRVLAPWGHFGGSWAAFGVLLGRLW